jgi:hypothetical protein
LPEDSFEVDPLGTEAWPRRSNDVVEELASQRRRALRQLEVVRGEQGGLQDLEEVAGTFDSIPVALGPIAPAWQDVDTDLDAARAALQLAPD